jgi:16S rRNA (guanine527-N7)-methyltransferase
MSPTSGLANRATLYARLNAGMAELGLASTADVCEKLLDYLELLERWNTAYNLTAVRDPTDMIDRHILDSLAIAKYVKGDTLVDIGSGAGLPGIPLAILDSSLACTLVDSNGKKARFLREAARTLALDNVHVENKRVEDVRGEFATVTARAFASVAEMVAMGGHLLARDGVLLAMKGLLKKEEILALPSEFVIEDARTLAVPGVGAARSLVIIRRATMTQEHAA